MEYELHQNDNYYYKNNSYIYFFGLAIAILPHILHIKHL